VSVLQTGDTIEETSNVPDGGSQDTSVEIVKAPVVSVAEEALQVHVAWRRGFADAALLGCAVFLGMVYFLSSTCGRSCFIRIARLTQVGRRRKTIQLPKPEPTSPQTLCGFKEPLLQHTGTSFAIPLAHDVENCKAFCFKIPRHPDGLALSASVTCHPEGSTWAKVQLFAGGDLATPLASCCLVQCTADVESRNIQGAMMSWLSLLLHEKEGVEESVIAARPGDNKVADQPVQSRVRACLHGIAEDLIAAGSVGSVGSCMRLEVRDSLGAPAGHLEPAPNAKPGWYVLTRQGENILEIEVKSEKGSMAISKKGEVIALVTHLGTRRDPEEPPEPTGEEDEHLQVDIREDADWTESALLLTCALAMVVFKPKANQKSDDDQVDVEA